MELDERPTVPVLLRRAASVFAERELLVTPHERITFAQLEAASRDMARRLVAAGAGKGTRVGLHLPNGTDWVIAFAAIARIGALAMPFSTLYRPAELRTALRIGDVSILISSATMLGKDHEAYLEDAVPGLAASGPGRLRTPAVPHLRAVWLTGTPTRTWAIAALGTAGAGPDSVDDELLRAIEDEVAPADWLVVIFTSGTTASPKAIIHSHGAAVRKTSPAADAALHAIFGGRVLSLMPFFWIGGLQEVLGALHSGATLLTLPRNEPAPALELARKEGATCIMGNLQGLQAMFGHSDLARLVPTLRPLPQRPWDGPASSRGDHPVGLGMSETFGPWAAVSGFECEVIDPDTGALVAPGDQGEFRVRGYSLLQGMYKREREDVFEPDGFFRTADLGYIENGKVYFTGRRNSMIKIRGANVAPAEIESVLAAQPGVRLAFAYGLPAPSLAEEIVAVVVPETDTGVDVDQMRELCRRELSPYKVPTAIVALRSADVPYLASSKPDRWAIEQLVVAARRARPESGGS